MRATSEPPPDVEDETNKHDVINPVQEYSWDWGAFLQPSAKPAYLGTGTESAGNTWAPKGRRKLRRRIDPGSLQPDERKYGMEDDEKFLFPSIDPKEAEPNGFGAGGKLLPSKSDPSKLIVAIEGRKIEFEVSLVPALDTNPNLFNGLDEVSAQQEFDDGKIDYHKLLEEEDLVDDHRLVILWVGDLYVFLVTRITTDLICLDISPRRIPHHSWRL
jgi:phosphatidate phosphatase LPIN